MNISNNSMIYYNSTVIIIKVLSTHKDGGHLIAVKTQLERVAEKKGCHDHSHGQGDRNLAPLEDM